MKKTYFIYACEAMYGGLHGMYDYHFEEAEECQYGDFIYMELAEEGFEMSRGVQESYSSIYGQYEEIEDENDRLEAMDEDIVYYIYECSVSREEGEELASEMGPEWFIKDYCKEVC